MAKRPDDSDEFTLEHDGDDDFGAAKPGNSAKAAGSGDRLGKGTGKAGSAIGGILTKLPIGGLVEKVGNAVDNVKSSVSASINDPEKPTLPLILLSGGVLVLVLVLILMVVLLVGSLSGGANPSQVQGGSGTSGLVEAPAISGPSGNTGSQTDGVPGISPDQVAGTVSQADDRNRLQSLGRDPVFSTPILPDEPALMRDGEIRYNRSPQKNWKLDDIRPGWQELGKLYRTMLREENAAEFFRLMGEEPPKTDMY